MEPVYTSPDVVIIIIIIIIIIILLLLLVVVVLVLLYSFTGHSYYVGVQYHPEYLTRPMTPSPPYLGFILASCNKLEAFLNRGCKLSPRASYDYEDDDDDEVTQDLSRMNSLASSENSNESDVTY